MPVGALLFKYVSGGLLFLCLVLGGSLYLEKRASAKKDTQLEKQGETIRGQEAELVRLSTEKDNQGKVTVRTVERVVKGDPEVKVLTKVIREAPIEADCKTPALDILRNSL